METDERLELLHEVQLLMWVKRVNKAINNGQLCEWVSTFHPNQLRCQPDDSPKFRNGGYNLGQRVIFSNGTSWLVRFAQPGSVCDDYIDEKVAIEVEALSIIRTQTNIPVPTVHGWGTAKANRLGLGPFIMMDFIDGVPLGEILRKDPNDRFMRDDITDDDVEFIYRQMSQILLKLFRLNFENIGSLPTPVTGFPAPARPLSFKVHDIIQMGGINTFGDRSLGFSDTTEYLQYVFKQDWDQLVHQPNSVAGKHEAMEKLSEFNAVMSLIPDFVQSEFNQGPYKLVCDDFGLTNIIVRSREDLTFVGVVDLEWSYAGPAQLFASPWWLLQGRLTIYDAKYDKEAPDVLGRFLRYLKIFKRVLKEEEEMIPGHDFKQLSSLVESSHLSGAMWLHILLSTGFNYPNSIPFSQFRNHVGAQRFSKSFLDTAAVETLVEKKVEQLRKYDEALDQVLAIKESQEAGEINEEEFLTEVAKLCQSV
ncbi:hypothetical protein CC80DRAFT_458589 [Byssothecium circinans]|uniref:Aminoglycoside phosphotransferase domain-containing protein n=1 Tax=Byssothecium circinans TaxID=147558 RepID=A0A6A5TAV4_9PLEO|nr:hypothetical protein CC80DRAFT_458589 [Byssothecium circinans]